MILALATTTIAAVPTAVAREDRQSYVTGADVVGDCRQDLVGGLTGTNLGSVCFDVQAGESHVDVEIDDLYLDGVGGLIQFEDADGNAVGDDVAFCGSVQDVAIPSGATSLEVTVNGPAFQFVDCETIATSTLGEVTAAFSTAS